MGSMFVGNAKTHLHSFQGLLGAVNKRLKLNWMLRVALSVACWGR
jgi:hypothetical protein